MKINEYVKVSELLERRKKPQEEVNSLSEEARGLLENHDDFYLGRYLLHDEEVIKDLNRLAEDGTLHFNMYLAENGLDNYVKMTFYEKWSNKIDELTVPIYDMSYKEMETWHEITAKDSFYNREHENLSDIYGLEREMSFIVADINEAKENGYLPEVVENDERVQDDVLLRRWYNMATDIQYYASKNFMGLGRELDKELSKKSEEIQKLGEEVKEECLNYAEERLGVDREEMLNKVSKHTPRDDHGLCEESLRLNSELRERR